MDPQLRLATDDDAGGIAAASVAAWQGSYRGIVADQYLDAMSVEEHASHWRAYDHESETWVAEIDGRVVGYVSLGPTRDADAPPGTGEVYAINIEPAAQGRGIGSLLLPHAVERLSERGFRELTLWTLEHNAAGRRFYERHGWEPDGATKELPLGRPTPVVRYRRAALAVRL